MNRRGFLKRGAMAAIGAAVAVAMPSVIKDVLPTAQVPMGVPFYVNENLSCMTYGGRRFVTDVNCPPDRVYFIESRRWVRDSPDGNFIVDSHSLASFDFGPINV